MTHNPDEKVTRQPTSSHPEPVPACITIAQARCADLRRAAQAHHALEFLLTAAQQAKASELLTHRREVAALLSLVHEESARRLDEVLESTEAVAALREAKRQEGGG